MTDALPQDEHAERGVIGCRLHGADHEGLDPMWLVSTERRHLLLAIDTVTHEGLLAGCLDVIGAYDREQAAAANAELAAHAVVSCGLWAAADDPRIELARCLDEATSPRLIDHYVRRLRLAWMRREAVERADTIRRLAMTPTTTEQELVACLA